MKAYTNETAAIHFVGTGMYAPRTEGRTNCGQPLERLSEMRGFDIKKWRRTNPHAFCIKCVSLTGG